MLSQPGQLLDSAECVVRQTTGRNHSGKHAPLSKQVSGDGRVPAGVNQRARVTVQRRTNTNKKVVSLSVEQGTEITSISRRIVQRTSADSSDVDKVTRQRLGCDGHPHLVEKAVTSTASEDNNDGVLEDVVSEEISFTSCNTKDHLTSLVPGSAKEGKASVPPYSPERQPSVRLRQAWASPSSQPRRAGPASGGQTSGTVPRNKADKQADLKHSPEPMGSTMSMAFQEETGSKSQCPDAFVGLGGDRPTLDSDKERTSTEKGPATEAVNGSVVTGPKTTCTSMTAEVKTHKEEQKKHTEIKPRYRFPRLIPEQRKARKNSSRDKDTRRMATGDRDTTDLKDQDRGDGEHITTDTGAGFPSGSHKTSEAGACLDDCNPQNRPTNTTSKVNKTKKKVVSLFSWTPFRKKPTPKQTKGTESKSEVQTQAHDKKHGEGGVAKTSMASDILHKQGKVPMPLSLTEMFAASQLTNDIERNTEEKRGELNGVNW